MTTDADDRFNLARFVHAQEQDFDRALNELRAGLKRSHWMWYIFPQFRGLGMSSMSRRYAIGSVEEARAYLEHPVLGPRLRQCVSALNRLPGADAVRVLGDIDAVKLRSCLSLFATVAPEDTVFTEALEKYFEGKPDQATLALLTKT